MAQRLHMMMSFTQGLLCGMCVSQRAKGRQMEERSGLGIYCQHFVHTCSASLKSPQGGS